MREMLKRFSRTIRERGLITFIKGLLWIGRVDELYEHVLDPLTQYPDKLPRIEGLEVTRVFMPISLGMYEKMGLRGFNFAGAAGRWEYSRGRHGSIVFWVSSEGKYVHRTGFATSREGTAYALLQDIYKYDESMDNGDAAYAGYSETAAEFRRKGVYSYMYSRMYRELRELGFKKILLIEPGYVIGPQKVQERLGSRVICEIMFTRILGVFTLWRIATRERHPRVIYKAKFRF